MFAITEVDGSPVFSLINSESSLALWRYDSDSDQFVTYSVSGAVQGWRDIVKAAVGLGSIASQASFSVNPLRKSQVGFKAYVI